jgi:hypothetical protein
MPSSVMRQWRAGAWKGEFRIGFSMVTDTAVTIT